MAAETPLSIDKTVPLTRSSVRIVKRDKRKSLKFKNARADSTVDPQTEFLCRTPCGTPCGM